MKRLKLKLRNVVRHPDGTWATARVTDDRDRMFNWYGRSGNVDQWINHPVSNAVGHGDGYWRRCPLKLEGRVGAFVRVAREAELAEKGTRA